MTKPNPKSFLPVKPEPGVKDQNQPHTHKILKPIQCYFVSMFIPIKYSITELNILFCQPYVLQKNVSFLKQDLQKIPNDKIDIHVHQGNVELEHLHLEKSSYNSSIRCME